MQNPYPTTVEEFESFDFSKFKQEDFAKVDYSPLIKEGNDISFIFNNERFNTTVTYKERPVKPMAAALPEQYFGSSMQKIERLDNLSKKILFLQGLNEQTNKITNDETKVKNQKLLGKALYVISRDIKDKDPKKFTALVVEETRHNVHPSNFRELITKENNSSQIINYVEALIIYDEKKDGEKRGILDPKGKDNALSLFEEMINQSVLYLQTTITYRQTTKREKNIDNNVARELNEIIKNDLTFDKFKSDPKAYIKRYREINDSINAPTMDISTLTSPKQSVAPQPTATRPSSPALASSAQPQAMAAAATSTAPAVSMATTSTPSAAPGTSRKATRQPSAAAVVTPQPQAVTPTSPRAATTPVQTTSTPPSSPNLAASTSTPTTKPMTANAPPSPTPTQAPSPQPQVAAVPAAMASAKIPPQQAVSPTAAASTPSTATGSKRTSGPQSTVTAQAAKPTSQTAATTSPVQPTSTQPQPSSPNAAKISPQQQAAATTSAPVSSTTSGIEGNKAPGPQSTTAVTPQPRATTSDQGQTTTTPKPVTATAAPPSSTPPQAASPSLQPQAAAAELVQPTSAVPVSQATPNPTPAPTTPTNLTSGPTVEALGTPLEALTIPAPAAPANSPSQTPAPKQQAAPNAARPAEARPAPAPTITPTLTPTPSVKATPLSTAAPSAATLAATMAAAQATTSLLRPSPIPQAPATPARVSSVQTATPTVNNQTNNQTPTATASENFAVSPRNLKDLAENLGSSTVQSVLPSPPLQNFHPQHSSVPTPPTAKTPPSIQQPTTAPGSTQVTPASAPSDRTPTTSPVQQGPIQVTAAKATAQLGSSATTPAARTKSTAAGIGAKTTTDSQQFSTAGTSTPANAKTKPASVTPQNTRPSLETSTATLATQPTGTVIYPTPLKPTRTVASTTTIPPKTTQPDTPTASTIQPTSSQSIPAATASVNIVKNTGAGFSGSSPFQPNRSAPIFPLETERPISPFKQESISGASDINLRKNKKDPPLYGPVTSFVGRAFHEVLQENDIESERMHHILEGRDLMYMIKYKEELDTLFYSDGDITARSSSLLSAPLLNYLLFLPGPEILKYLEDEDRKNKAAYAFRWSLLYKVVDWFKKGSDFDDDNTKAIKLFNLQYEVFLRGKPSLENQLELLAQLKNTFNDKEPVLELVNNLFKETYEKYLATDPAPADQITLLNELNLINKAPEFDMDTQTVAQNFVSYHIFEAAQQIALDNFANKDIMTLLNRNALLYVTAEDNIFSDDSIQESWKNANICISDDTVWVKTFDAANASHLTVSQVPDDMMRYLLEVNLYTKNENIENKIAQNLISTLCKRNNPSVPLVDSVIDRAVLDTLSAKEILVIYEYIKKSGKLDDVPNLMAGLKLQGLKIIQNDLQNDTGSLKNDAELLRNDAKLLQKVFLHKYQNDNKQKFSNLLGTDESNIVDALSKKPADEKNRETLNTLIETFPNTKNIKFSQNVAVTNDNDDANNNSRSSSRNSRSPKNGLS